MKKYIKPVTQIAELDTEAVMFVVNSTVGDDVQYGKRRNKDNGDVWDFEEDDED